MVGEGWRKGDPASQTLLATLTLGSEKYSVAGLVAVGLAVVLGTRWGGG